MKKYFLVFLLFCLSNLSKQNVSAQNVSVNFQVFYDELSPFGMWVDNADYGYVWVPNLGADFRPYSTNGYWIYTEEGWTWVSNYSWGWAPFHYGRWYNDAIYGSIWVPDNQWGPGWVNWRSNANYFGWSPMRPNYGMGHHEHSGGWRFVRSENFGRRDINNYYINRTNNTTIINNTTVINNIHTDKIRNVTYNSGPNRKEVEKHTGKAIQPMEIKENDKPGQHINDKQLEIYRPQVNKNSKEPFKPVPPQLMKMEDIKTREQKTLENKKLRVNQPNKQAPQAEVSPINHQPVKQAPQAIQPDKQPVLPPQKIDKPIRQQPVKQQPLPIPNNNQPIRQQPTRVEQPIKQLPLPVQNNHQPIKAQPHRVEQPIKEQSLPPRAPRPPSREQSKTPVRDRQPHRDPQPAPSAPAREPENEPDRREEDRRPH